MNEVRDIFIKAGISPISGDETSSCRKVVCTCGSGVTAAALAIGLEECGLRNKNDITIFDGSWIEWGSSDKTPIVSD
jgi:thiosulfate/3-mercaptopyruvate sulfurtransferase